MQRSLLHEFARSAPRGYVPVLQDHPGERQALSALGVDHPEVLETLTPVIQIVGGNKRELTRTAIKGHVARVANAVGDRLVYLDFIRADPARHLKFRGRDLTTAEITYDYARRHGLAFVPVVWTTSKPSHLNAAANSAYADGRGVALRHRMLGRVSTTGASVEEILKDCVRSMGLDTGEVDLWLDLQYISEDVEISPHRLERVITRCEQVGAWRRIFLTGSSMPSSLGCVPEGTDGFLPRREWQLWSELPAPLRARLDFGDYAVQHPTPPKSSGPGMRANIRYTVDNGHFIVRGLGEYRQEGAAQYVRLCERVARSQHFAGAGYTWGDKLIAQCANNELAPGNQTMWRAVGTAHHLRVVSEQVRGRG